jgi:hypothetical protein
MYIYIVGYIFHYIPLYSHSYSIKHKTTIFADVTIFSLVKAETRPGFPASASSRKFSGTLWPAFSLGDGLVYLLCLGCIQLSGLYYHLQWDYHLLHIYWAIPITTGYR